MCICGIQLLNQTLLYFISCSINVGLKIMILPTEDA